MNNEKENSLMITREKIVEEIKKVPDEHLEELYHLIQGSQLKKEDSDSSVSVMKALRDIRISAAPDFSVKADLYDIEDENGQSDIH